MKLSLHISKATDTAKHNDRSMYKNKACDRKNYVNIKNKHYDMYKCNSSVEAEEKFYDEYIKPTWLNQTERNINARHKERNKTWKEYKAMNPLQEMIIQLGNKDEQLPIKEDIKAHTKVTNLAASELQRLGMKVISLDIHFDETSTHAHIRYAPLSQNKNGEYTLKYSKKLKEQGYKKPSEINPEKKIDKRKDTVISTFTADLRNRLEDYIENELEIKLDRKRLLNQHHSSHHEFKTRLKTSLNYLNALKGRINLVESKTESEKEKLSQNQQQFDKYYSENQELETETETLRKKAKELKKQKLLIDKENITLEKEKNKANNLNKLLSSQNQELSNEYDDIINEIAMKEKKLHDSKNNLEIVNYKISKGKQTIKDLEKKENELLSIHNKLIDMEDNYYKTLNSSATTVKDMDKLARITLQELESDIDNMKSNKNSYEQSQKDYLDSFDIETIDDLEDIKKSDTDFEIEF